MPRLFVDVDDTLVKWGSASGSKLINGAEDWKPNCNVVRLMQELKVDGYEIIVWSAGGDNYALMWADRLVPNLYDRAMAKFALIPLEGDLFIDDIDYVDSYPWVRLAIHPDDLCDIQSTESTRIGA